MKKNKGYTLAEILIAMGIIGVLAALTIPPLYDNHRRNVWASTLSAGISAFENAMTTMIEREDATNLFETPAWQDLDNSLSSASESTDYNKFVGNVGDSLKILNAIPVLSTNSTENYYTGNLKSPNRTEFSINDNIITLLSNLNLKIANTVAFECKNGVTYLIQITDSAGDSLALPNNATAQTHEAFANSQRGMLANVAAFVFIDVNGKSSPNTFGYDLFGFVLGSDGILYPVGGKDFAIRFLGEDNVWSYDSTNNPVACTNNKYPSYGLGCTARLIENGFKVDDEIDY